MYSLLYYMNNMIYNLLTYKYIQRLSSYRVDNRGIYQYHVPYNSK